MFFSAAVEALKSGERVRRASWGPDDPSWIEYVAGREVVVDRGPKLKYLEHGTKMSVEPHVDAIFVNGDAVRCIVGAHNQLLSGLNSDDWEIVSD